jgi:hypothetical protein
MSEIANCFAISSSAYVREKKSQLMDYMVSLHFIDFISWDVLDNGPCYTVLHFGYIGASLYI